MPALRRKVLIIEDSKIPGENLCRCMQLLGYQEVLWVTGIQTLNTGGAQVSYIPNPEHFTKVEIRTIEWAAFDIALVDAKLDGSTFQGWTLVPLMVPHVNCVIGISAHWNDELMRSGAKYGIDNKRDPEQLYRKLVEILTKESLLPERE